VTKPVPAPASEPLLDLPRLVIAIRRGRRLWMAAGLLGLLAGALLTVLLPPTPTAVARLLIVHEGDQPSDDGSFMKTDVALLETTRIAAAALQTLGVNESPDRFLKRYKATGLTNNVVEVTVRGSSDGDAVARVKALADAYIADHVQRSTAAADAQAQAWLDRRNQTQAELAQVEAAIAATPRTATGEAASKREDLIIRRADLSAQVSELAGRAEEAAIGAPRVAAGTHIVDGPRALRPQPLPVRGAVNTGIGLMFGLAAGLALAAVASVVRERPLLRHEIAAHLGASVIAQLPRPARLGRRRSRAVVERRRVAATLARAVADGPAALSLLELGCARTAAALAMDIAEKLAIDSAVVIVDGLPHRYLRKHHSGNQASPIRVEYIEDAGHQREPVWPGTRRIGVGSVAPGTAWTDLGRFGSETVLVVRAGHASPGWLHTVARQLADCQVLVIGVVLVDPDPRDRSDGTLWDGLHTALRGRAPRDHARNDRATLGGGQVNVPLTPGQRSIDD
jgi:hypothetical protein